jgi:hypothetical protein
MRKAKGYNKALKVARTLDKHVLNNISKSPSFTFVCVLFSS